MPFRYGHSWSLLPANPLSSYPEGIAASPDGNLWLTESGGNKIGRITIEGVITEYAVPTLVRSAESLCWGWSPSTRSRRTAIHTG